MTDAELLSAAGHLLYGDRWQRTLAAAWRVDQSLVSRWASGERPVPDPVIAGIPSHLRLRADALNGQAEDLRRFADSVSLH
jgi:hypothetical protein